MGYVERKRGFAVLSEGWSTNRNKKATRLGGVSVGGACLTKFEPLAKHTNNY